MFVTVDKSYKDVMRKINKVPLAIRAATQPGVTPTYCSSLPVMLNEAEAEAQARTEVEAEAKNNYEKSTK